MKNFLIIVCAGGILVGCSDKSKPRIEQLEAKVQKLEARLDQCSTNCAISATVDSDIIARLENYYRATTNIDGRLAKIETDIGVRKALERWHLLNDPATRDKYSATNNPAKLNPDTGLPWESTEK